MLCSGNERKTVSQSVGWFKLYVWCNFFLSHLSMDTRTNASSFVVHNQMSPKLKAKHLKRLSSTPRPKYTSSSLFIVVRRRRPRRRCSFITSAVNLNHVFGFRLLLICCTRRCCCCSAIKRTIALFLGLGIQVEEYNSEVHIYIGSSFRVAIENFFSKKLYSFLFERKVYAICFKTHHEGATGLFPWLEYTTNHKFELYQKYSFLDRAVRFFDNDFRELNDAYCPYLPLFVGGTCTNSASLYSTIGNNKSCVCIKFQVIELHGAVDTCSEPI